MSGREPSEPGRLETELRSLPRAQASPGFTRRLLARVSARRAPQRSLAVPRWVWLAAAGAMLLLWMAPRAADRFRVSDSPIAEVASGTALGVGPLDAAQVRLLRARRAALEQELGELRQLAAKLPPVVGIEGPTADYLVDLGELAAGFPSHEAQAVPASYRPRP
ncbi:MAG TPA: hypothetical protein VNB06_03785 [Thermoanaerobaculia bacterium]|nr:hypothetical protein [Thermoanaerobaculia bacterium]